MKVKLLIVLCLILVLQACRKPLKDFDDYFPEITVTAIALPDGSVKVTAAITEEGALAIEMAGLSFGENSDFSIDQNQVIVSEIVNNTFSATYPPGFDMSKTYYFKAWITNSLGYKASTAVSVSNIVAEPVDGPCSNPMNYLWVYLISETAGTPSAWQDDTDFNKFFNVSGSYSNVKFTFDALPGTGVYTTTQFAPGPGQVRVSFTNTLSVFIQSSLNPNQSVYVNQTSPTTWTFEICSATWTYNSGNYTMSTYFSK